MIKMSKYNEELLEGLGRQKKEIEQQINIICATIINEKGDPKKQYSYDEFTNTLQVVEPLPDEEAEK